MSAQARHILLVEDNTADARLIEVLFSSHTDTTYLVSKTPTLAGASELLTDGRVFDLVLLDLNLPDSESLDTLRKVAALAPDVPVVVLSGHTDEDLAVAAVRAGAQDYLVKGWIDSKVLSRAVRYAIERKAEQRERDRAVSALAKSEERLRLVTEASTDGIWDWDLRTGEMLWSDRMYELLRRARSEQVRPATSDLKDIHPDDREFVATSLREHFQDGKPYNLECRLLRGDASFGYFHINGKTVRDEHGVPIRMAGSITDITERRRAEAALRASEQRFQGFMDNSPAVSFMKDEWGRYVYVNAVFDRLFGDGNAPLVGKTDMDVWPGEVAERLRAADRIVIESQKPLELSESVPVQGVMREWWTVKFLMVEAGNRRYVCGVSVDITERRRAEEALREADEKLRQSQKMEAIGQLASGVAHDFNNLLTAIRGYASLVRNRLSTDHPALESLEQVEEASRQATGVAGALLTFARKAHTEKVAVQVAPAVETAARLFRRTLPPSVRLVMDTGAAEDLWVNADSTQLQQVVINLGLNARDAIGASGTLTIALKPASKDGTPIRSKGRGAAVQAPAAVNIIVSDTGTGMTPDVKARIFEPFFTTKPRGRGTGLGLAVIHSIVQDHGAAIRVDTQLGKGSTFTITFPLTTAPASAPESVALPESVAGGTVLLAEDNQLVRGLLASMLSALGFEVVHASSADEALRLAASINTPIHLLVAAQDLQGRGAVQMLADLRARGHVTNAVIVASGGQQPLIEPTPGVTLLKKPFQLADLRHAIAQLAPAPGEGVNI